MVLKCDFFAVLSRLTSWTTMNYTMHRWMFLKKKKFPAFPLTNDTIGYAVISDTRETPRWKKVQLPKFQIFVQRSHVQKPFSCCHLIQMSTNMQRLHIVYRSMTRKTTFHFNISNIPGLRGCVDAEADLLKNYKPPVRLSLSVVSSTPTLPNLLWLLKLAPQMLHRCKH